MIFHEEPIKTLQHKKTLKINFERFKYITNCEFIL
jgi:hypothetical protein